MATLVLVALIRCPSKTTPARANWCKFKVCPPLPPERCGLLLNFSWGFLIVPLSSSWCRFPPATRKYLFPDSGEEPDLCFQRSGHLSLYFAYSRTTSFGFLSSLLPRNTACRNRSSRVHSVNLTWQTINGFTQRQRFISAAVKPWSQRLRPGAGRLEKGQLSTRIFCKSSKSERRSFSLNPVPTLPANFKFVPS